MPLPERTDGIWHGYPAGRRPGPAATATASTARSAREPAIASTPPSCCSIPTPRRSTGGVALGRRQCGYRARRSRRRRPALDRATTRARMPQGRVVDRPGVRLGAATGRSSTPWHETRDLRGCTSRASRSCTPTCREDLARHLRRARRATAAIDHFASARRHRGRAAAGAPHRRRALPARARADATTGATTRSASSRPTPRYRRDRRAASRSREFRAMVKALHRAGIEVILDVVYNHTAEGNHLGPTLSFTRHRQRLATTG